MFDLLVLFSTAFLSATFVPLQSEIVFSGLVLAAQQPPALLLIVASVGNTLGSAVNWWLGRWLTRFEHRPWFPVKKETLLHYETWFQHYGKWSLLLSWVPIIGDPLTLVAGVMRVRFFVFLLIVAFAKTMRYAVLLMVILKMV